MFQRLSLLVFQCSILHKYVQMHLGTPLGAWARKDEGIGQPGEHHVFKIVPKHNLKSAIKLASAKASTLTKNERSTKK